jgi:hypothetical protein
MWVIDMNENKILFSLVAHGHPTLSFSNEKMNLLKVV